MSEVLDLQLTQGSELLPVDMASVGNLFLNTKQLNAIGKYAAMYSKSSMVPAKYQGSPENCFVALELSTRMNISPMVVMQNLYVVKGIPAWSGQGCIALINGSGLFSPLEYVSIGEEGTASYGCYAQAIRYSTGKLTKGTAITIQMALDEGWMNKDGSKWKTMPDQMLKYRAASFFARTECPNVLMGYQTVEEVHDVYGYEQDLQKKTVISIDGGNE